MDYKRLLINIAEKIIKALKKEFLSDDKEKIKSNEKGTG